MKYSEIEELVIKLDECGIEPSRLALLLSKDDATELVIDLDPFIASTIKNPNAAPALASKSQLQSRIDRYVSGGIAHRLVDGGMLCGMQLVVK